MSDLPPVPPPSFPAGPPPGYVTYGTPQVHGGYTKRIRGIGRALMIVQIVLAIGSGLFLAAELSLRDKAQRVVDGELSLDSFEDDLGPFGGAVILTALASIAATVLLIVWSYRIASNLRARQLEPTWKPGLTIVAWLLSGCTLNILPFLMLREHWNKSEPNTSPGWAPRGKGTAPVIIIWFALTLGQLAATVALGIRGVGGVSFGNDSDDLADNLSDRLTLIVVSGALALASSVALIFVVKQLTERHAQSTGEA